MTSPDAAALELRRQAILAHETETARAIAVRVVEKPALSVWMILMPFVLLHYMQRQQTFRQGVAGVSEELLRTRRRALEQACEALLPGSFASGAGAPPAEEDVRLRAVRAAEAAEVAVLAAHYRRLLQAQGADYGALVRNAYGSIEAYREIVLELGRAEDAVVSAALEVQSGVEGASDLAHRLEQARSEVRMRQVDAIFRQGRN